MSYSKLMTDGSLLSLIREAGRYLVVSVVALIVDMLLLLILAEWIHYALAASISFLVGAGVHYLLSIVFVFRQRRMLTRRMAEVSIFFAAGFGALLLNVGVIALCVELLAAPLAIAKLVAAGFSFIFGYVVRKLALF